jgi:tetratricopeptide (TPR) repeat protein
MLSPKCTKFGPWVALLASGILSCWVDAAEPAHAEPQGKTEAAKATGAPHKEADHKETSTKAKAEKVPIQSTKVEPTEDDGLSVGKSTSQNVVPKPTLEYVQRQNVEAIKKLESIRDIQGSSNQWEQIAAILRDVLLMDASHEIKRSVKQLARLELAGVAEERGDLSKAQQYLAEYVELYPNDPIVPEIFLRQAYLFRQMGAYDTALSKLYLVLRSALGSQAQNISLPYFGRVVLTAKTEIAETYYLWGRPAEAAEKFALLVAEANEELNQEIVRAKLIRALSKAGKHDDLIKQSSSFLSNYPGSEFQAEVRYLVASAYRTLGQKQEALQQLLLLLEAVEVADSKHISKWKSWKMIAGNEIGNQLFLEGDFINAVKVYKGLLALDESLPWKLPIHYQVGLCFERLMQPEEALKSYQQILSLSEKMESKIESSLQMVIDMARFRVDILSWKRTSSGLISVPLDQKVADLAKP